MSFNFSSDLSCYSLSRSITSSALASPAHAFAQLDTTSAATSTTSLPHLAALSLAQGTSARADAARSPSASSSASSTASATAATATATAANFTSATSTATAAMATHPHPLSDFRGSMSKLDVLIHTAASAHRLDVTGVAATGSPSPLPNSLPLPLPHPLSDFKRRKLSSSLDFLCSHAQRELESASASAAGSASTSANATPIPELTPSTTSGSAAVSAVPAKKSASNSSTSTSSKPKRVRKPASTPISGSSVSVPGTTMISRKPSKSESLPTPSSTPTPSFYGTTAAPSVAIKLASPSTNTKRQRSGPSCDCCRSRKIKCDSEIFILPTLDPMYKPLPGTPQRDSCNSHIALCQYVSMNPQTGYQYYQIVKDEEHALNNRITSFNYLQFRPCSACVTKALKCSFSKGFTRNDIIKFNKAEAIASVGSATNTGGAVAPASHLTKDSRSANASTGTIGANDTATTTTSASATSTAISNADKESSKEIKRKPQSTSSVSHSNTVAAAAAVAAVAPPSPALSTVSLATPQSSVLIKDEVVDMPTPNISSTSTPPSEAEDGNTATKSVTIKERKSSKKTSCKTCRFKKIKCVKVDGFEVCFYCKKKGMACAFE